MTPRSESGDRFGGGFIAPKAHLRSSAKRTIVSLRAVRVRVCVCVSVCLSVCNHTFGSVATSKVNGTANRLTRL